MTETWTEWEWVADEENRETHRMRVPGGWLVRETLYRHGGENERGRDWYEPVSVALVFVADSAGEEG